MSLNDKLIQNKDKTKINKKENAFLYNDKPSNILPIFGEMNFYSPYIILRKEISHEKYNKHFNF